jgi:hypothetical protein
MAIGCADFSWYTKKLQNLREVHFKLREEWKNKGHQ